MSAIDQLIHYIKSLTPEQADRVAKYLPLLSAYVEPANEKEKLISAIITTLLQTKDIALLEIIHKLLLKRF